MPRTKLKFSNDVPQSIRRLVRSCVKKLKLELWSIEVLLVAEDVMQEGDEPDGLQTVAQIAPATQYRKATLWLPELIRADDEGRELVLHELAHLLVSGFSLSLQQWFAQEAQRHPKAFTAESFSRLRAIFDDAEDAAIEHLLDVIG